MVSPRFVQSARYRLILVYCAFLPYFIMARTFSSLFMIELFFLHSQPFLLLPFLTAPYILLNTALLIFTDTLQLYPPCRTVTYCTIQRYASLDAFYPIYSTLSFVTDLHPFCSFCLASYMQHPLLIPSLHSRLSHLIPASHDTKTAIPQLMCANRKRKSSLPRITNVNLSHLTQRVKDVSWRGWADMWEENQVSLCD